MSDQIEASARFFDNRADSSCNMLFDYDNNVKVCLRCSLIEQTSIAATIYGEHGKLMIHPKFLTPTSFTIENAGKTQRYVLKYCRTALVTKSNILAICF